MNATLSAKLINVIAAALAGIAVFLEAGSGSAHASGSQIVARISISEQRMDVLIDGCIRLHPDNAADLYQLVQAFGPNNTSIVIVK